MTHKFALCCYCLLAGAALAQDAPSEADLDRLNDTIARVENRIEDTSSRRSSLETELIETEQRLVELNTQIRNLGIDIADQEQGLTEMLARSAVLNQRKEQQQGLIKQYIFSAYQSGREEYLKLLLNQENIDLSARTLRYYQYFNSARAAKIEQFNTTLQELRRLQEETRQTRAQLERDRTRLSTSRTELEDGLADRQRLLAELDTSLRESGQELEKLQREREEMELLIEELNRSIANLTLGDQQQPFGQLRGRLPWPTDGPLLNAFGARHDLGDLNWQGVTIAADAGEDIRAIHHGRVVFADWFASSGLLLIIDHGDGYMSLYAHNQLLYHQVGDWVTRGEIIAAAGNTGGRRETGVYFEIRENGRSVDPIAWCMARGG